MTEIYNEYKKVFEYIDKVHQSKKFQKFKITLRGAASNIKNLIDALLRKSLLKKDLYQYDNDGEETFYLPDQKYLAESDISTELYKRLSATINALEFQAEYMPDSLVDFTDEYLENCRKILDFFSFHNYNSSNSGINTRTLKNLTDRILNGNDELLKKTMEDLLKVLLTTFHSVQSTVEDITKILKEKYKAQIRFDVFPNLPNQLNEKYFLEDLQGYTEKIEKYMKANSPGIVFKKYWIVEAIKECYTTGDDKALEKIKSAFLSDAELKVAETHALSPRQRLLSIIYTLVNCKDLLDPIYYNLSHNVKMLRDHPKSFMEQIQELLKKMFNFTTDDDFFHIEYINPKTNKIQNDTIKVDEFLLAIKKKIRLFNEIAKPDSNLYVKINRGTQTSLIKFLDETYFNLLLTKERISGLNTEIRLKTPKGMRNKLKINTQLTEKLNVIINQVGSERRQFIINQEQFKAATNKDNK